MKVTCDLALTDLNISPSGFANTRRILLEYDA